MPCAPCPARSTFTEEAERTCKGDFLCDKMSLSASGLLYHFDKAPADYSYGYKKHDEEYKKEEVGIWGCKRRARESGGLSCSSTGCARARTGPPVLTAATSGLCCMWRKSFTCLFAHLA